MKKEKINQLLEMRDKFEEELMILEREIQVKYMADECRIKVLKKLLAQIDYLLEKIQKGQE